MKVFEKLYKSKNIEEFNKLSKINLNLYKV